MTSKRNGFTTDLGEERVRWVEEYRASGLGLKQFAQRHGVSVGQLRYWVYASPSGRAPEASVPVFQEVRLPAASGATSAGWAAEVGLPDGTTVRLAGAADLAWTRGLVESLRRPCSPP